METRSQGAMSVKFVHTHPVSLFVTVTKREPRLRGARPSVAIILDVPG